MARASSKAGRSSSRRDSKDRRFDKILLIAHVSYQTPRFPRLKDAPEHDSFSAAVAIQRGLPFSRRLTDAERLTVAISGELPSHFATIDSTHAGRDDFHAAFRRLIKRLNRLPKRNRPLIYVATTALSGDGDGGHHLHALLWEYLRVEPLAKHCREAGLGVPQIRHLAPRGTELQIYLEALDTTRYVLGQHSPVFGSRHHERHLPLPAYAKRYLYPQVTTLAAHRPSLLAALDRAKDRSVPDDELARSVPVFSNR